MASVLDERREPRLEQSTSAAADLAEAERRDAITRERQFRLSAKGADVRTEFGAPGRVARGEFEPGIITRGMIAMTIVALIANVLFVDQHHWLLVVLAAVGLLLNVTVVIDIRGSGIPFFKALKQWSARERRSRTRWIWIVGGIAFGLFTATRS